MVDTATPAQVIVRAASSPDTKRLREADHALVAGTRVPVNPLGTDAVALDPPKQNADGQKNVELLDNGDKSVAKFDIEYKRTGQVAGGTNAEVAERLRKVADSNWYYALVTFLYAAIVLPFAWALLAAVWRGSGQEGSTPLGLPVGTVRSVLAYALVAFLGFYVLASVLSLSVFQPPEYLTGVVATVIGFYFGSRSREEGTPPPNTGTLRGTVKHNNAAASGAVVRFKRKSDGVDLYSRIADSNGRFELTGVAPGTYQVTASLGGATSQPSEVTAAAGGDQELELVV